MNAPLPVAAGAPAEITDREFDLFRRLIHRIAGISLSDAKKVLLVGRLSKRLALHGCATFTDYYRLLASGEHPEERQQLVDALTTNETYFFREPAHFEFLRAELIPARPRSAGPLRIWSAACSTGEEVYTLAMVLDDALGERGAWEVLGSDISTRVLEKARAGHYPLARNHGIPPAFLAKHCLKGVRAQAGTFLIGPALRRRVSFRQVNLLQPIDAALGEFEVIFLRNVMIYFDQETKARVVANLAQRLAPGGHLVIGHAETLNGIAHGLETVRATLYRKPPRREPAP